MLITRRLFLQIILASGVGVFLYTKRDASAITIKNKIGLPAGLPFCLAPSPKYVVLEGTSRPTGNGGQIVRVPRRRLLRFWETYD